MENIILALIIFILLLMLVISSTNRGGSCIVNPDPPTRVKRPKLPTPLGRVVKENGQVADGKHLIHTGNLNPSYQSRMLFSGGGRMNGKQYSDYLSFINSVKSGKEEIVFGPNYVVISQNKYEDIIGYTKKTKQNIIIDDMEV